MLGYCCRRLQFLLPKCRNVGDIFQKETILMRSYSSESLLVAETDKPVDQGRSFTVSYLINSCGLSPKLALSASKKVQFDTRDGPDSVLNLLKEHGFTNAHISILVRRLPNLLLVKARKTLLPKFEFFSSVGISGTVLARIICYNANIIHHYSLKRTIIPCYEIIERLRLLDNFKFDRFFISLHRVTPAKVLSNTAPNISVLRALKVPETSISYWVAHRPVVMAVETEKFKENVNEVIRLGLCPSSSKTFMKALVVITEVDASERAQRMETYRKWGWTEADCLLAFRKNPLILSFSEKNFSSKMDFLVNRMGWQPADVAERPTALTFSLEKWIIPRCSVIKILLSKSLIVKEEVSLGSIVISGKQRFLDRFVVKYQEQLPELLSIFQAKTGLAELGLGFEDADDKL